MQTNTWSIHFLGKSSAICLFKDLSHKLHLSSFNGCTCWVCSISPPPRPFCHTLDQILAKQNIVISHCTFYKSKLSRALIIQNMLYFLDENCGYDLIQHSIAGNTHRLFRSGWHRNFRNWGNVSGMESFDLHYQNLLANMGQGPLKESIETIDHRSFINNNNNNTISQYDPAYVESG